LKKRANYKKQEARSKGQGAKGNKQGAKGKRQKVKEENQEWGRLYRIDVHTSTGNPNCRVIFLISQNTDNHCFFAFCPLFIAPCPLLLAFCPLLLAPETCEGFAN